MSTRSNYVPGDVDWRAMAHPAAAWASFFLGTGVGAPGGGGNSCSGLFGGVAPGEINVAFGASPQSVLADMLSGNAVWAGAQAPYILSSWEPGRPGNTATTDPWLFQDASGSFAFGASVSFNTNSANFGRWNAAADVFGIDTRARAMGYSTATIQYIYQAATYIHELGHVYNVVRDPDARRVLGGSVIEYDGLTGPASFRNRQRVFNGCIAPFLSLPQDPLN